MTDIDDTVVGTLDGSLANVEVALAGHAGAGMSLGAGTLIGTINAQVSFDGAESWTGTYFDDPVTDNKVSQLVFTSSNPQTIMSIIGALGATHIRVIVASYTSGSATCTLTASNVDGSAVLFSGQPGASSPASVAFVGGIDQSSILRGLSVDTSGNVVVVGAAPSGISGPVGNPVLVAGVDGSGIVRQTATDISGHPVIVGAGAIGAPAGGVVSVQGTTSDGSFLVNQGNPNSFVGNSWFTKISDSNHGPVAVKPGTVPANINDASLVVSLSPSSPIPTGSNVIGSAVVTQATASNLNANVSGTVTANIGTTNGLALDITLNAIGATLINGTQVSKITDGTNNIVIKSASVPVAATDPALVVGISPNNTVATTAPTLVKGTQSANGWSVQELKDAGRVNIMWVIDAQSITSNTETLLNVGESRDGGAITTFTSKIITAGKRLRINSISVAAEAGGSLPVTSRLSFKIRFNALGAVTTASPLQSIIKLPNLSATAKNIATNHITFPDGIEFLGDGTKQIGFTILCPDWVTSSNVPNISLSVFAFEY